MKKFRVTMIEQTYYYVMAEDNNQAEKIVSDAFINDTLDQIEEGDTFVEFYSEE